MPASVPSPDQALYRFNCSPLLLLPGSLARITHRRASLFLIKLLWKRGKSRRGRSWGEAIFMSKILHRSVYSALWLGGLRFQYRRQTNGPLDARCPCVMVLGKKKIIIKNSVGPFSASAHRENARYARLPIQTCVHAMSWSVKSWSYQKGD